MGNGNIDNDDDEVVGNGGAGTYPDRSSSGSSKLINMCSCSSCDRWCDDGAGGKSSSKCIENGEDECECDEVSDRAGVCARWWSCMSPACVTGPRGWMYGEMLESPDADEDELEVDGRIDDGGGMGDGWG